MRQIKRTALLMLAAMAAGISCAQTSDYNPANPDDPMMKTKVVCTTDPSNAGYTSGGGSYVTGTEVSISTSAKTTAFDFEYWTLNGEKYTEDRTFTYTTTREQANFVAVYNYNPKSPGDPQTDHNYHLNLSASPSSACSFNMTSGSRHLAGSSVTVTAYPNQYYVFDGWYLDGKKVSADISYTLTMPEKSITLTAIFTYDYDPASPSDPSSSQTDVDNTDYLLGDVNGDGSVDVSDASAIVSYTIGSAPTTFITKAADYNHDGSIDVSDASAIVSKVIGAE